MAYKPPSVPDVSLSIEEDVYRVLEALKKIMDVREGRFDNNQRWITMQDLIDFGLQTVVSSESPISITSPIASYNFQISGDIIGGPVVLNAGNPVNLASIINLPNIVLIDGGDAAETFPGQPAGPYGVLGTGVPAGGLTNQILAKLSNANYDTTWINQGTEAAIANEYCPGYTYANIDIDEWRVVGLDVTNLFSVGRRLKFVDGANLYYGTITASVFTAGNTDMTMSMEGGDNLTGTITEVCLTTSTVSWSAIVSDPFGGTSINDIISGYIGATKYWVAIGDGGKLATSTDAGATWTIRTTGTTENLNQIDYNPTDKTFVAVGNVNVTLRSINGTTWALNTSDLAAITTTGTGNVVGVIHDSTVNEWCVLFNGLTDAYRTAKSVDDGVTWTNVGASVANIASTVGFEAENISSGVDLRLLTALADDLMAVDNPSDVTFSFVLTNTQATMTALTVFYDGAFNRYMQGFTDGVIVGTSVALDDVTFGVSSVNGFAHSDTHGRTVAVGHDGKIGYIADADLISADSWTLVANGFDPLTDIKSVHWDADDGIFVACASNGQICRSTNGIS